MNSFAKKAVVTAALVGGAFAFGGGQAFASADADAVAAGSPGVLSGNVLQAPIHVPVNFCGNSINGAGILNPTFGNTCINADGGERHDRGHEGRGHQGRGHEGRGHEGRMHHQGDGRMAPMMHEAPEIVAVNKAMDVAHVD